MTGQYLSERSYGWYKGHAIGVPSNSNSIESTHKHMKTDPDLTSKKSLRHFLGSVEKGLIYNWSMNYNPDGNPNVKVFSTDIEEFSFTSFDQLIECVMRLHLIKINVVQWQLSECSCYMWLKNFKCNHVIAVYLWLIFM